MEKQIPIYRAVLAKGELDYISLVDKPAIVQKGLAFAESVTDYPKGISETAQRALNYVDKNGWGSCGTDVGKTRAHQLAKGDPISIETINRMYSFLARHKGQDADKGEYGDGCARLMYDAWGGDAAYEWSGRFLDKLKNEKLNKTAYRFEYKLQFADEDKQIIVAPAMIPDFPIYRFDDEIGEYAIIFDAESIAYFQESFAKSNKNYKINFDHLSEKENGVVESAFIKSQWIIESRENDKSNHYGFRDLPVGTWMVEVKVDDKDFWRKKVKEEKRTGFSVEGLFELEYTGENIDISRIIKMDKEKMDIKTMIEKMSELTPDELALIKEAIADKVEEVLPELEQEQKDELVEEVVDQVEEVVEDLMPEQVEEVEEALETETATITIEDVEEYLKPKMDEIYALIAELKKEKVVEEVVETPVAMSKTSVMLDAMKSLKMSGVTL